MIAFTPGRVLAAFAVLLAVACSGATAPDEPNLPEVRYFALSPG